MNQNPETPSPSPDLGLKDTSSGATLNGQNGLQVEVVDRGHAYRLPSFDGEHSQTLTFMKREGEGFPGNIGHYPGTNLQSVLRACLDRVLYLQSQIPHDNNSAIICHLRHSLRELEQRAAERHGFNVNAITLEKAASGPMCPACGHVVCWHTPSVGAATDSEKVLEEKETGGRNALNLDGFFLSLPANGGFRSCEQLNVMERATIKPRCPYCGTTKEKNDHTDTCPVGKLLQDARAASDGKEHGSPRQLPKSSAVPDVKEEEWTQWDVARMGPPWSVADEHNASIRRVLEKKEAVAESVAADLEEALKRPGVREVEEVYFGEPGAELAATHVLQIAREAWEAGIRIARAYGDNVLHLAGEQKERQWEKLKERLLSEHAPKSDSASGASSKKGACGSPTCGCVPAPSSSSANAQPAAKSLEEPGAANGPRDQQDRSPEI